MEAGPYQKPNFLRWKTQKQKQTGKHPVQAKLGGYYLSRWAKELRHLDSWKGFGGIGIPVIGIYHYQDCLIGRKKEGITRLFGIVRPGGLFILLGLTGWNFKLVGGLTQFSWSIKKWICIEMNRFSN